MKSDPQLGTQLHLQRTWPEEAHLLKSILRNHRDIVGGKSALARTGQGRSQWNGALVNHDKGATRVGACEHLFGTNCMSKT